MHLLNNTLGRLLSCLIFFTACNNPERPVYSKETEEDSIKEKQRINNAFIKIDSVKTIIKTGDLVFRTGNDFTSESLRSFNQRDKTYSHCGIAVVQNDTVFVYHSLGGEWNPDQKIRKDPLEVFAEPYSNRGIGVYRYPLSTAEIQNLITTVKRLYTMGIMFDMKFDLKTQDRMYCTEFVYKACVMGTGGKLQFTISKTGDFEFVGTDDLFLHPLCSQQKKILY